MDRVYTHADLPPAPWYVSVTDNFLSGWGPAQGMTNRLILPCENLEEAEFVAERLRERDWARRVTIASRPRMHRNGYLYQCKTRDDMPSVYPSNA